MALVPESSFFVEEGFEFHRKAVSQTELEALRREAGRLQVESGNCCVRHLGNRSRLFRRFASSPRIAGLVGPKRRLVRGILFDKTAEENWPVAWHQDRTISVIERSDVVGYSKWTTKDGAYHVEPPEELLRGMISLRLHLDDVPTDNGPLQIVRASHRLGVLADEEVKRIASSAEAIVCEASAGDILAMSPLAIHSSRRSTNPSRRRILHLEFADRNAIAPAMQWFESA